MMLLGEWCSLLFFFFVLRRAVVETVLVLIQVVSLVRLPGLALRIECPKTREAVVCKTEGKEKGGGGFLSTLFI